MNTFTPITIFSAEKENLSNRDNFSKTSEVLEFLSLQGIPHKVVKGYWKGNEETSILVTYSNSEVQNQIRSLAGDFNQDAILEIDTNRQAYIVELPEMKETHIGKLREVTREFAQEQNNYTYDPETKTYWVCD